MKVDFKFEDAEELKAQLNEILKERNTAFSQVPVSALRRGVSVK